MNLHPYHTNHKCEVDKSLLPLLGQQLLLLFMIIYKEEQLLLCNYYYIIIQLHICTHTHNNNSNNMQSSRNQLPQLYCSKKQIASSGLADGRS